MTRLKDATTEKAANVGSKLMTVLKRPPSKAAYVGHAIAAAVAAACLLLAILGWNEVTEWLSGKVFSPGEHEVSEQAETWTRVALALVALALLVIRGIWLDVAVVLLIGLALSAVLGSGHATQRTFAEKPPAPVPTKTRLPADARIAVPAAKVQAPPLAVPRDEPAVLVTVVAVRDTEGRNVSTQARRHVVTPRQELTANDLPAEDLLVDVTRGEDDEMVRALIADLAAAKAVYVLPG